MIVGFRHRGLGRLFRDGDRSGIRPDMAPRASYILGLLDTATDPSDLRVPGYRLHPLQGDRKGTWSMTVNANWRIVFRFDGSNVTDVDLVDYH